MRTPLVAAALAIASTASAQSMGSAPAPMSTAGGSPPTSVSAAPPAAPTPPTAQASAGDVYAVPLTSAAAPAPPSAVDPVDAALPLEALARAALEAHPDVVAAKARLGGAKAEADRLRVGDYETTFDAAAGARHVADYYSDPGRRPGATVAEGYVGAQRAFRLPGKAALDRRTGALGVEAASDEVDDARHQTGLALADAWFAWVQASAEVDLDRSSVEGAQKAVAGLRRRVQLKDAAPLELDQAQSALAVAQAKVEISAGDVRSARIALEQGFPDLPLPPRAPVVPDPLNPPDPPGGWREAILARSHEIRIAELKADQQRAVAARARLDQHPDPTFGVRAFDEQGDRERGVQLTVSIPFGGARRSALYASETAKASDLQAQAAKVRREILALAGKDVAAVSSRLLAWRAAKAAQEAGQVAARLQRRAYELGEKDLAETLLSNGQVYQAMRAEIDARVEAWRAVTKLRLDAHALWADPE